MAWTQYRNHRSLESNRSLASGAQVSGCSQVTIDDAQELAAHVQQFVNDNPYRQVESLRANVSLRWSDVDPEETAEPEACTNISVAPTPTPSEAAFSLEALKIAPTPTPSEAERAGADGAEGTARQGVNEQEELRDMAQQYLCEAAGAQVTEGQAPQTPMITTQVPASCQAIPVVLATMLVPMVVNSVAPSGLAPAFPSGPAVVQNTQPRQETAWRAGVSSQRGRSRSRAPLQTAVAGRRGQQTRRGERERQTEEARQEVPFATEETWESRMEKRLQGLSDLRESDVYTQNQDVQGNKRPQTPDYRYRCSKRTWEKQLGTCRGGWRRIHCERLLVKNKGLPRARAAALARKADGDFDEAVRNLDEGRPGKMRQLAQMGFTGKRAADALKQSNNDVDAAVEILLASQ